MQIFSTMYKYDWNLDAKFAHLGGSKPFFYWNTYYEVISLKMVHLIVQSYFSVIML